MSDPKGQAGGDAAVRVADNEIIAIDGPSGTGKSTVARTVAERIGAGYLDTGALYRIVALHILNRKIDPHDDAAVADALTGLAVDPPTDPGRQRHQLDGDDVSSRIRDGDVTAAVTPVSANPAVRAFLLDCQRSLAYSGRMVIEGRDIGTVIAADARVKIYLTADADVRARRRFHQDGGAGRRESGDVTSVAADLDRRDRSDSSRTHAPLQAAPDAVVVDSTELTIEDTVRAVLDAARERGYRIDDGTGPGRGAANGDAGVAMAQAVSQPVRWFHLGGDADPVPVGRRPRDVDRGRRIGIALSRILYRMTVIGERNMPVDGPVVVVANHTTFMDGPILFGRLPRRISFLVKAEVLVGPLGWLLRTVGQYAIDRAAPQRDVLMAALDHLKAGGVIGIFPEGQRTDGSVAEVFNGAGWLAARAGATVVPVAVRGTARPRNRRLRRFQPRVYATVGEPFVVPRGLGRTAINAATATIQQRLAGLVAELDRTLAEVAALRARPGRGRR